MRGRLGYLPSSRRHVIPSQVSQENAMKTHIITAALLLIAAGSLAQVRETVNVNVVEVPVTVVDSSGNPIRGLTKANFELLDQGKKRDITSFDKIDFGA